MTPIKIGTTQATRAVALGTIKLKRIVTTIAPINTVFVDAPSFDMTVRAIRRSSPVMVIAAAIIVAAATRLAAGFENPDKA